MDRQRWGVKEKIGVSGKPNLESSSTRSGGRPRGRRSSTRGSPPARLRGMSARQFLGGPTSRRRRSRMPCTAAASCSRFNVATAITPNSSTLAEQIVVYFRWTRIVQRHAVDLTRQGAEPGAYAEAVGARDFSGGKFIEHSGSLIAADRYRSEVDNQLGYVACSP
jgi:hypothetical protein